MRRKLVEYFFRPSFRFLFHSACLYQSLLLTILTHHPYFFVPCTPCPNAGSGFFAPGLVSGSDSALAIISKTAAYGEEPQTEQTRVRVRLSDGERESHPQGR